eukprot:TRINITY_DN48355_c0_g1_i1.p1 TRINITY_DN48355_c0_g1~~TRINITY_DN48355_c0_g1_i1.p1  ORF type:complete len:753 (+),score=138.21 TRINITY_DN48355_c0_g1_i1:89-2260(+)
MGAGRRGCTAGARRQRRLPVNLNRTTDVLGSTGSLSAPEGARGFFWKRAPSQRLLDIDGLEAPHDFPRLAADAIAAARNDLRGVEEKGPEELVTTIDNASNGLCRIADAAELCRNVHPNQEFVAAASEAVGSIAAYMGEVNFDVGIYEAMQRGEASADFEELPVELRKVLQHMRVSMEHEGIHLPEAEKAECLTLLEREQTLSFEIVQEQEQLRQAGTQDVDGYWLPVEKVQAAFGGAVGSLKKRQIGSVSEVHVPSDVMWLEQLLKHAPCADTRRLAYEGQQAIETGELSIAELRFVRHRLARIRGYDTWCDYAQRESLLHSPEQVLHFLEGAWERLRPGLEADLRELAAEKELSGLGEPVLEAWDLPLLLNRSKRDNADTALVSPYLSYASLMRGVELVLSRLLGVAFASETPGPGEVWHPSVQKYTLRERDHVLGILYLDPFSRPGKTVQMAQFTVRGSKELSDGSRQTPVTALAYSLPPNGQMSLSLAVSFMHEIGHAMHSLLSETKMQHLSGTRGAVDFVEFPSHLFEHFVLDMNCLSAYATHSQTGAAMSFDVQERCRRQKSRFAHFEAVQQLMYAIVDQSFYSHHIDETSGVPLVHKQLEEGLSRFDRDFHGPFNGNFSSLLGLSRPARFDHLIHYGGSYYCYLFNRALSAHVWQHGFQDDPFGEEPGRRLRGLFRGGSVVQNLDVIEALCPNAGGLRADSVPLDAFVAQLQASTM